MKNEKLKSWLLDKVENTPLNVEKVERYINLVDIYYQLDEEIERHGVMVVTENGSQSFIKPNPAIAEKNKISTSLLNIEKTFGFDGTTNAVIERRELL